MHIAFSSMAEDQPRHVQAAGRAISLISYLIFYIVTLLFVLVAIVLIFLAFDRLYLTVVALPNVALDVLFECIGFTTVAAAVFELARTMFEEDIQSRVKMNAPRKVRRFISRFMTVIIISLAIEFLTMVFRYSHKPNEFGFLINAAVVAMGVAAVFIAWSVFNWTSVPVEQHEDSIADKPDDKE
jgi:hypothetical protein